jgi:hypothetical protein
MMLALCAVGPQVASQDQQAPAPLPELEPFLKEVRQKLRTDRALLSQYTYTVRSIERSLDDKGNVKKIEEEISESYESLVPALSYRRVISRNGKPVPQEELEKQDRKHEKRVQEHERKLEREGKNAREERLAKEEEERRKEAAILDELFALYEIRMVRRDTLEGVSSILVEFAPRSAYKPKSDEAKILKKIAGRAWICEDDHEVVRVEAELLENHGIGGGILARLNRGSTLLFQRRRVNDEIWLPAEARFTGSGRILLFKGIRIDVTTEFFDYRKFMVDTNVIIRR